MAASENSDPHNVKYWAERWEKSNTGWHVNDVNPNLVKHFDRFTLTPNNLENKKVFVPLCGKTRDIGYLLSRGLKVFAVEGVRQPIEELDKENLFNLQFDESQSIFHTEDNQLQIYLGDLCECPIEKWGPFDYIWDRGSFIAVEYQFRLAYKKMMQRSVRISESKYHDFRYLLESIRYDKTQFAGPPRSVDEKDLEEFFEDWTNVENLSTGPVDSKRVRESVSSGPCESMIYLLTPK